MNEVSQARPCSYCGHVYLDPCDGKPDCPNRIWRDEHTKRMEFIALCEKYLIAPGIAVENNNLLDALSKNDMAEVERILKEEF